MRSTLGIDNVVKEGGRLAERKEVGEERKGGMEGQREERKWGREGMREGEREGREGEREVTI